MLQTAALHIAGRVEVTTRVNVRQGAPSTTAAVLRKLNPGTMLNVQAIVAGEPVQGNAHWYEIEPAAYIWSGACGPFMALPAGGASEQPVAPVAEAGLEGFGLTEPFMSRLAELLLECRKQGYDFRISQGLRTPRTQARYYCQWKGRLPDKIDERVAFLRGAGAPWLADLLASYRDIPRMARWQTNALPGAGWHQWGEAADCYCHRNGTLVQNGSDPCYEFYAEAAEKIGLTAGLRFSQPDPGHVQLRKAGGATSVYSWEYIDGVMQERFADKPEIV